MANDVLLDNVTHKDLRIITEPSARFGDNIPSVLTFPFEFRDIQTHYPICFCKNPETGQFYAAALMGFEENENLFLGDEGWDASYVPLMVQRQPFMIGFHAARQGGAETQERLIHIDMDSPRISSSEGEAVFLEQGGNTPYLERISSILEAIYQGQEVAKTFIATLLEFELIEPFTLNIQLDDGSDNKLLGFYTINEDKLAKLSSEKVVTLLEAGFLEPVYMVIASMSNFRTLIERKNKRTKSEPW